MSKFLILGGAGFIGSNFAKYVLNLKHEVIIIDNISTTKMENFTQFEDNDKVELYIRKGKKNVSWHEDGQDGYPKEVDTSTLIKECDYIIHLAASVGVQYVEDNPQETILNNLRMEEDIFYLNENLYQTRPRPIFFASTSEVYGDGDGDGIPFRETDDLRIPAPTNLRWGYACSKLMGEFLLHSYKQPFVIGRFFNVTSRNQLSDYGMVLPNFVENVLVDKPLTIYNQGKAVRSYCHIDDAVEAMYKLITNKKCYGQIFNIGNPENKIDVYGLAKMVNTMAGKGYTNILLDDTSRCNSDINFRVPNIDKIKSYIDWEPKKDLDSIISDMIIKNNEN